MPGQKYCVKCKEWFPKDEYGDHVAEVHPEKVRVSGPLVIFKGGAAGGWTPRFHGEMREACRETRRTHGEAAKNLRANTRRRAK